MYDRAACYCCPFPLPISYGMYGALANLLLIAGPSGCGKSYFIRELITGRAPTDIVTALPDAGGWPTTSVKRLSTGKDNFQGTSRLIVHYDTMRPY